jgi:tRNA(Ile)-lysidine synthase
MSVSARRNSWPQRAAQLAARLPRGRLHPAVLAWAQRAPGHAAWGVAFSGGSDSLALLLLVWAHWPEHRPRLWALHFDHRLRGAAAQADARFCARVCRALGIPLAAGRWRQAPAAASEAQARAARLAFFEAVMARRRIRALWLGHQLDDVAETLLMRLARGSGTGGLAAPRPVQPAGGGRTRLRPLLSLKKAELKAALGGAGIPWREDRTNAGAEYFRNRVRRRVIGPWMRAARRDAMEGAALSRSLLEEDDTALEAWADRLQPVTAGGRLRLGALAGAPRAIVRRALHRWVLAQGAAGVLSRQGFERLLLAVEARRPTRQSFGPGRFAVLGKSWLRCVRERSRPVSA